MCHCERSEAISRDCHVAIAPRNDYFSKSFTISSNSFYYTVRAIHPSDDFAGWVFQIHLLQLAGISVIAEFKTVPRKKLANLSFLDTEMPRFTDFCHGL